MKSKWLIKVYSDLLRGYPKRFYAEHADEMIAVFGAVLHEARQDGTFTLAKVLFRELFTLPFAIMRQHFRERNRPQQQEKNSMIPATNRSAIRFVRWLTRLFGLLSALFYIDVLLRILPGNPQLMPLIIAFFVTTISIILAWKIERTGGILTILCSVLLALAGMYGTYSYEQSRGEVVGWVVLLAGLLWGFPFLAVGWLFIKVSQAASSNAASR